MDSYGEGLGLTAQSIFTLFYKVGNLIMIREIKENKVDTKTKMCIKEATDFELARPNHNKILSIIDRYELHPETILKDLLSYLPDDHLAGFAKDMESDYCDEEEDN